MRAVLWSHRAGRRHERRTQEDVDIFACSFFQQMSHFHVLHAGRMRRRHPRTWPEVASTKRGSARSKQWKDSRIPSPKAVFLDIAAQIEDADCERPGLPRHGGSLSTFAAAGLGSHSSQAPVAHSSYLGVCLLTLVLLAGFRAATCARRALMSVPVFNGHKDSTT